MSNWELINKCRVPREIDPIWGSTPEDGFNGAFQFKINGLLVNVIASDGRGWRHVSVSLAGSEMTPSWSIMSKVADLFWEPEDWICQYRPAASEYVDLHQGTLHWWQPLNEKLPKPDHLMVGFKNQEDIDKINADPQSPVRILPVEDKS